MHLYAASYDKVSPLGDVNIESTKDRTPIIILHGLFGSHRNWHSIAKTLSEEHTVYALDMRNHGQSPHSDIMDYPHMAQDVLTFISQSVHTDESRQSNYVNIIAHSMGGKAAMWLALSHPEVIKKLIIVDIAPLSYEHDFSEVVKAFKSVPLDLLSSRRDAEAYLTEIIHDSALRQFLLQNLQLKEKKFQWRLNLDAISRSISNLTAFPDTASMSPYMKPVLFISGGQSDYINKERQKQTKVLFPRASFTKIKSAGHWLHAEQPDLFKALISSYLYYEA